MNNIKTNNTSSHETQNCSAEPEKQVDAKDSEKFKDILQEHKHAGKKFEDGKAFDQLKDTYGQSILAGLMGQSQNQNITSDKVNVPSVREIDTDTLNKLVDSILVASSENKNEVRINIKNDILSDTQIILRLETGKLFVEMQTSNNDSAMLLHQNVDALTTRLQASCKNTEIGVNIVELGKNADNQQGDNQGDQRSRGNFLWEDEA